jgi:hypothetical protein
MRKWLPNALLGGILAFAVAFIWWFMVRWPGL